MLPSTARLGPLRSVGWIALVIGLVFLVFFSVPVQADPLVRLLSQCLIVLAVVVALVTAWQRRAVPSMLLWAVPYLAVVIASSVTSERSSASREAAALITLAVAAYPGVWAIWRDARLRPRLEWLLVIVTAVIAVSYLLECLAAWLIWWSALGSFVPILRPGAAALTFGSPNAVAMYLEVLLPLATVLSWQRWRNRLVTGGLVTAGIAAIFLTGSRGAWVAAGLVLIVALVAASRGRFVRGGEGVPRWAWVVAVAVVITLAVAAPAVADRISIVDAGRFELWQAALSIFAEHPLLGSGPATWGYLRPLYPTSADYLAIAYTPHNVPIHIAAETGVLGIVASGIILLGVIWNYRTSLRATTQSARWMVVASAMSITIIVLHSAFDSMFFVPGFVLMLYIALSYADHEVELRQLRPSLQRSSLVGGTIVVVIAAAALMPIDLAMFRAKAGDEALGRNAWVEALDDYAGALALDPGSSQYDLGRAISLSHLDRPKEALKALADVARSEPFPIRWAEMARLQLPDDRAAAVALAQRAMTDGAYDPTALINAAAVLDAAGEPDAVEAATRAIMVAPYLVTGRMPAGIAAATWDAAASEAISRLRPSDPLQAADVALRAGRLDLARSLVEEGPAGPERDMLASYLDVLGGGVPDWVRLRGIVAQAPTAGRVLDWYVRIARQVGAEAEVDRGQSMAAVVTGGSIAPVVQITTFDPSESRPPARIYGYPNAVTSRTGPARPYLAETLTIEGAVQPGTTP